MATPSQKILRVLATKPFMRFAERFGSTNEDLVAAMKERPEANLGGSVSKFRIARTGGGKSGGARAVVALRAGERIVMMHGFEKKDQDNITPAELKAFKRAAKIYLEYSNFEIDEIVKRGALIDLSTAAAKTPPAANTGEGGEHGEDV